MTSGTLRTAQRTDSAAWRGRGCGRHRRRLPGPGHRAQPGRHHIPVCVIDDETSIARASRFVQNTLRVRDLRSEQALLDALALARKRFGLAGWVLYPTREENVAGLRGEPGCSPAGLPRADP